MKKMMSSLKNILLENRWLLILLAVLGIAAFILLWTCSMKGILKETKTAYDAVENYWEDTNLDGWMIFQEKQEI